VVREFAVKSGTDVCTKDRVERVRENYIVSRYRVESGDTVKQEISAGAPAKTGKYAKSWRVTVS